MFFIFFGHESGAAGSKKQTLESLDSTIEKALKAADQCIPQWKGDKLVFCTGFTVSKMEMEKTFLADTDVCLKAIKKAGYTPVFDDANGKIPKIEWQEFQSSTEEALAFHQYRIVAFKKSQERLTCAHELIHVWQHSKANDSLLAPVNRSKVSKSADTVLAGELKDVEKLEKTGQVEEALRRSKFAEDFIGHLKQYNNLVNTLDEIEAHDFIFQNCTQLKCTDDDLETAVANLAARSSLLPQSLRVEVDNQIHNVVLIKRKQAIAQAKKAWKPLAESTNAETAALSQLDWKPLIGKIEEKGIKVLALLGTAKPPLELGEKIPPSLFASLDRPTSSETLILKDSKLLKGDAVGKYICKPDSTELNAGAGRAAIVVTDSATKETLIHEFLHFLQSQLNSDYCPSVYGQEKIEALFHDGKMDRKTHDDKLLFAQSINSLAEQEVYATLLANIANPARLEKLNDQLMKKHYDTWLAAEH